MNRLLESYSLLPPRKSMTSDTTISEMFSQAEQSASFSRKPSSQHELKDKTRKIEVPRDRFHPTSMSIDVAAHQLTDMMVQHGTQAKVGVNRNLEILKRAHNEKFSIVVLTKLQDFQAAENSYRAKFGSSCLFLRKANEFNSEIDDLYVHVPILYRNRQRHHTRRQWVQMVLLMASMLVIFAQQRLDHFPWTA